MNWMLTNLPDDQLSQSSFVTITTIILNTTITNTIIINTTTTITIINEPSQRVDTVNIHLRICSQHSPEEWICLFDRDAFFILFSYFGGRGIVVGDKSTPV